MELRTLARANMMAMPEIVRIAGRHLTKSRREIQIETFFSGASSTRSCGRYSPSYVSSYLRVKRSPEMVGAKKDMIAKIRQVTKNPSVVFPVMSQKNRETGRKQVAAIKIEMFS